MSHHITQSDPLSEPKMLRLVPSPLSHILLSLQHGLPAGLSAGLPTECRGSEHADTAAADGAEPGPQPDAGPDQLQCGQGGLRGQVTVTQTI